ncbi:nuclear GTPase SLIP-GC-like isoform X2 [Hoplias malabaricus]|uniref:nuclear GTPase SLIP-GC-like isoform X2 n=1 Tax=Hoplias malabaricus TaxID=27720 RepID=UPI00346352DB
MPEEHHYHFEAVILRVIPYNMSNRGDKRTFGNANRSSPPGTSKQRRHCSPEKTKALTHIRNARRIMANIKYKLEFEGSLPNNLIKYVRGIMSKLDSNNGERRRTTVGVFGRTGAGKSSMLNAVLGQKDLLPSGTVCACTSVIIQVEANVTDSSYIAEIEFISKEVWEDELRTLKNVLSGDAEEQDNAMLNTAQEKIVALYGEEGVSKPIEELMKDNIFSGIPEFFNSEIKKITRERASDLSDEIGCFVQHDDSSPGGCYWPIVKSVTIKVPKCKDFLEHVVLVDLPGTGDYNKSRDQMWREKLRDCSTVWIVSEINRAASDKDAWEIFFSCITDMAQGGECRSISFICTKTDDINPQSYMRSSKLKDDDFQIKPEDPQYVSKRKNACILHRNEKAKEKVKKIFSQQDTITRHFNCDDDFLSVFTVSSEEFNNENPIMEQGYTEIPKLKELLKMYNNSCTNDMANHYVFGALGILSLIQGFNEVNAEMRADKSKLYKHLEKNLHDALGHLNEYCGQIRSSLEELLSKGAKESEKNCIETANDLITPRNKDGRGFHRTLTALCKNDGYYRSKNGVTDLNNHLVQHMKQHIDEAFSGFFPVQEPISEKSLQAHTDKFTIIKEDVITKYEHSPVLSHILKFLEMEEMKLKSKIKQDIIRHKKTFYLSLSDSIKTTMQPSYTSAADIRGTGSMNKKQNILLDHIETSKSEMFQRAKKDMIELMEKKMQAIVEDMRKNLLESMKHTLLYETTLRNMDVSGEIEELKRIADQLCD